MNNYKFTEDDLHVLIAMALCNKSIGDPFARDIHGSFRYNWYLEDAEKFLKLYKYKLEDKKVE